MWGIALLALGAVSAYAWVKTRRYSFDALAIVAGSAGIMFLVDYLYAYLNGENPVETGEEALLLTSVLVLAALGLWGLVALYRALGRKRR